MSYVYADDFKDWFIGGVSKRNVHQLEVNLTVWGMEPIWFDDRKVGDGSQIIYSEKKTTEKTSSKTTKQVDFVWNNDNNNFVWTAVRMDVQDVSKMIFNS